MTKQLKQIIRQPSLTETTAELIRDSIIAGKLELGSKLSEQRLADMLGVSRSPVHDALAVLQSEGLVVISPKRGSFVFTPNLEEVDDICEHRCLLETASLRRAFSNNREELIEGLLKALNAMESAIKSNNATEYTKGDINFHNIIVQSGGNRSIASAYRRTVSPLMALRTHLFTQMSVTTRQSMDEHLAVINACKVADIEKACKVIEEHSGHLLEAYRAALKGK